MSNKRSWSTANKLTFWGLVLAVITGIVVPVYLHLAKSQTTATVSTPVEPVKPAAPLDNQLEPPAKLEVHVDHQTKSNTVGKKNVTGNNVAGNGNVVGNNNQTNTSTNGPAVASITQGPGSIAQVGGVGNQATIIGVVPPKPRKLSEEQVSALTTAATGHPAKILILYIQHDEEAYQLGKQIGDALTAAGWTLKQPPTEAMVFGEGGAPLRGMLVTWPGEAVPPGDRVHLDSSTSWGTLSLELMHAFPEEFHVNPAPRHEEDFITLTIYINPQSSL